MNHFRALEALYLEAPVNRLYQPIIRVDKGTATVTVQASSMFHHTAGGLHGSVYFKLLDDAAFLAVASLVEDVFVVTSAFNILFVSAVETGTITATGTAVRVGSTVGFGEARLVNASGEEVSRGQGTFARTRARLDGFESYRKGLATAQ
jgi:uncharacterized protein (TIGR00369 family)